MKLEIHELSKSYDKNQVLKDINFTFESGKIYGLIGRNGAGKTTFFNALNQDIYIDSGRIYLEDEYGKNKLTTNNIGYVISTPVVPEFLTGREFLDFFIEINKDKIKEDKTVDEWFDLIKIDNKSRDKLLKEYSHGMKNKIQILINIIASPKVILLDEPLTSLDIVVQEDIKNIFRELKKDHIIILSTHILELAMDLCDEIVILNNKTISEVEKEDLNTKKYKDKIIKLLREENNDK